MTQTQSRPAGNGAAVEQVGETTSSVPRAWHEQADWEGRWQYAAGHADGYGAAEQAIANEITQALGVQPMEARTVIRWLIAGVGIARKETPA
jgi:hypothetical protein